MVTYVACLAGALVAAVDVPTVVEAASPTVPLGLKAHASPGVTFSTLSGGSVQEFQSSIKGSLKIVPFAPRTTRGIRLSAPWCPVAVHDGLSSEGPAKPGLYVRRWVSWTVKGFLACVCL